MTIEFWANPSSVSGDKRVAGTSCAGPEIGISGGSWLMCMCGVGSSCLTGTATANQWQHIVGVWENSTSRKLYVNGVLQGTNTYSSAATTNWTQIGARSSSYYYAGKLDEVRIYTQALISTEIQKHYAEGLEKHRLFVKRDE